MSGGPKIVDDDRLRVSGGVAGRGVFATRPLRAGEPLIRFTGPLLRYAQTSPQTLAVQIGPDLYLGSSGGLDDYVNHCCEPNAGLVIDGRDVTLVAVRDIAAGEEVYFDYSTTMDEDDFEMPCACARPSCRGTVRDFKHLPPDLKRRYVALGIIPAYNRRYAATAE